MPAIDAGPGTVGDNSSPARNAVLLVPSDSLELEFVSRALYTSQSGAVRVQMQGGQTVIFNVSGNVLLPIRISKLFASGTTVAVIALW